MNGVLYFTLKFDYDVSKISLPIIIDCRLMWSLMVVEIEKGIRIEGKRKIRIRVEDFNLNHCSSTLISRFNSPKRDYDVSCTYLLYTYFRYIYVYVHIHIYI